MTLYRIATLKQTRVNEPIDPAVFAMQSLGAKHDDRLADWIEHRVQVFDGKQWGPAEQFERQPKPPTSTETALPGRNGNKVPKADR